MNRYAIVGVVTALALCGCSRPPATQQESTPGTATAKADRPLTMVGCLVPDGATTQSGAARSAANPPPPGFTLVEVTIPARDAAAASGVSGTSGTGGIAPVEKSYKLVADKDRLDDLQRFANSRVQVIGSIVASTGTGTTDVGAASAPVRTPPGDVPRLRISDVRQLEPSCGAAKKQ